MAGRGERSQFPLSVGHEDESKSCQNGGVVAKHFDADGIAIAGDGMDAGFADQLTIGPGVAVNDTLLAAFSPQLRADHTSVQKPGTLCLRES